MENCSSCLFCSYRVDDTSLFDRNVLWCSRLNQKVSSTGYCNHYCERPTASNSGYTSGKSGGGCYLTSACVEFLGKQDDCEELTILRKFRDTYMKTTDVGKKLVEEYYIVAPKIVEKINVSPEKANYYEYIYKVIQNCLGLIRSEKLAEAQESYIEMTNKLIKELL